jgi:hypothetical protein
MEGVREQDRPNLRSIAKLMIDTAIQYLRTALIIFGMKIIGVE